MASIKLDHGVPLFIGAQMAGCYPRKRHQCDMWECPLGPIAAIGQQKYDRKFDPPFGHRAIKSKIRRAVWSDGIHIRHEQQILHKLPDMDTSSDGFWTRCGHKVMPSGRDSSYFK